MFPANFIRNSIQKWPDAIALDDGATQISYRELGIMTDALAAAFQHISAKARPTVAIFAYNTIEHTVAHVAIHVGGAILVPLNPRYGRGEIASLLATAKPDLIVLDPECRDQLPACDIPTILTVSGPDDNAQLSVADLIERFRDVSPVWPQVTLEDIWAIKFTSGSSGKPKGVMQSFRSCVTSLASIRIAYELGPNDIHLCAAPMTHASGMYLVPTLASGGCNRLVKWPSASEVLELMEHGSISLVFMPPTLIYKLIETPGAAECEFRTLRFLIYGGAPMPPDRVRQARDFFGGRISNSYGQTEMPMTMAIALPEDLSDDDNLAIAGRINPFVECRIVDETGVPVGTGQPGEIIARSDLMMSGYLDQPDATAETIRAGWLYTGDIGVIDDRGYLSIVDRKRDVIITGGFNVYPSDVETILSRHPAVREGVVFGVEDAMWGERVEAAVELVPGSSVAEADIIAFLRDFLGSLKTPKAIHIVADLPRSSVGKVVRREAKHLFGPGKKT